MKDIILASTSPYRRALLDRLGIVYSAEPPHVDETAYRSLEAQQMARTLAREKALAITRPHSLVIGADQVVEVDGGVLGKPGTATAARAQLERLSNRAHRLLTAVAVHDCDSGVVKEELDIHTLWMRPLTPELIEAYVAFDQPLDCAGAYKLESRGIGLFERIEADPTFADDSAIVGLPVGKLLGLLRGFGWELLSQP